MACPTIKINVSKGYTNNGGGLNPTYTYYSQAFVEVISGMSTSPIQGTLELKKYDNTTVLLQIYNYNNSYTIASFTPDTSDFYDYYLLTFNIILNNGECVYNLVVNTGDLNQLPCETIISGVGGAAGDPSVIENCAADFIIDPIVYGCTDPNADNYNPEATVDDGNCTYENAVYGCTDPNSFNYNPFATIDDGSCVDVLSGCTDPNASNYSPDVVVDDGSCIYLEVQPILGCTNPLATNYNANATFNDGTCIFLSGCTNPVADNYNENAVIDDGSCECNKAEILFNLNGQSDFYFLNSGDTNCDYYLEFKYRIVLNCTNVLEYFQSKTDATILQILDRLKLYSEVRYETTYFRQLELDINPTDDLFYLELSGDTDDCYDLQALIAAELGEDCPKDINDKFSNIWRTARLKVPSTFLNKVVQIGMFLEGFTFGGNNVLLDDIKLYSLCFSETQECIIIPYNFGFQFEQIEDNVKSVYDLDTNKDIWNTKELTLKVDIPNYITNDVVLFLNTYEKLLHKIFHGLTTDSIKTEFTPVRSVLTNEQYYYLKHLYEMYLKSFEYCNAPSKSLDYSFIFEVFERLNKYWNKLMKQFLPETAIWKDHNLYYSNLLFHQQKFSYKNYLLTKGEDENELSISCALKTVDKCTGQTPTFSYQIDDFFTANTFECLEQQYATPINLSETNYGAGRFIQYNKEDNTIIERHDYPNQNYGICL
jgi:hypothetical protein